MELSSERSSRSEGKQERTFRHIYHHRLLFPKCPDTMMRPWPYKAPESASVLMRWGDSLGLQLRMSQLMYVSSFVLSPCIRQGRLKTNYKIKDLQEMCQEYEITPHGSVARKNTHATHSSQYLYTIPPTVKSKSVYKTNVDCSLLSYSGDVENYCPLVMLRPWPILI